jgi:outer membrane receptor protein involved in Fe transport
VNDWLNLLGRISLDSYDELHEERVAVGSVGIPAYTNYVHTFRELNYDLMANVDKDLSDNFNLKGLVGANIRRTYDNSLFTTTNGGLVVPGLYALSNSVNPLNVLPTDEIASKIAVDGYFAGFTLGYKELLTLDGTARIDRASSLPVNNLQYFYPSVSASFLFSKLIPEATWLSSGKLRANYAQVGNSAPFASLQDFYFKPAAFGASTLFSIPDTKNNANLKPERTKSKELGLEMSFFKSRLGLDVTYYDAQTVDQILPVAVSTASGYTSKYVNAGTLRNRGVEVSVYATPIRTQNFSWNFNLNWTRNRNKVLSLFESSTNLQINPLPLQGGVSINATLGQPYGSIQGKTWQLVDKDPSKRLVGADGYYVQTSTTNNVIGNINPDWTGGMYNTVKYKNVSLGFLVDMRQGGDVFSLDLYYGFDTGLYPETAGLNDLGNPSRAPLANGGGLIVPGYTADGKVNTKRVANTASGFYGYSKNPAAQYVYDASYVKLRELNLTYSLPDRLLTRIAPIKGIDFSVVGRNLWIIHKNLPYADPEDNLTAGNIQGYQSGAFPTTRTLGFNLKLRF